MREAAAILGTTFEGQVPLDVVVFGALGLLALFMIVYAAPKVFRRGAPPSPLEPPAPPLPLAGTESQMMAAPGAIQVKITKRPEPAESARVATPTPAPGRAEPRPEPAKGDPPSGDFSSERERLKAEFTRSAEAGRAASGERTPPKPAPPPALEKAATPPRGAGKAVPADTTPAPLRGDRTARQLRPGSDRAMTDRIDARFQLDRTERTDMRFDRDRKGGASGGPAPAGDPFYGNWKEKRIADELAEQNTELTNLLTMLPGIIKRLTETSKKRELAPMLADIVMRLCMPPPEKVMVFFLAKNKEDLILASSLGYDDVLEPHTVIKVPKHWGRIGYALKHQLSMDEKDFERDQVDDDPLPGQGWRVQVASPLVYNREVLGAISVEGFAGYSKNGKRFVGIAASLGALAISLAEKTAQIQHQANSDALTSLYNKRYFFERLEHEVEKARESGRPLSIFMFDIDHFKKFNDRNGHQAGDEALRITGALLNERKRETDIAARYGGEEFIVILPDTPKEGGYIFGESFRRIVESYPYPHGEGQPLGRVSISGGVSTFPEDGQSPTALIEAADECLYRSKEHGRNHVTKRVPKDQYAAQPAPGGRPD
jgi:diguanylate cyclase (GGDEF)-like protein